MFPQRHDSSLVLAIDVPTETLAPLADLGAQVLHHSEPTSSLLDLVLVVSSEQQVAATRATYGPTPVLVLVEDESHAESAIAAGADYVLESTRAPAMVGAVYLAARRETHARRRSSIVAASANAFAAGANQDVVRATQGRLAAVAHDINNPLQYILTGIEELTASATSADTRQLLEEMREAADRIHAVTRSLLPSGSTSVRPPASMPAMTPTTAAKSSPPTAKSSPPAPTASAAAVALRILVVDDEEPLLRTYKRCLRGYDVVTALGGQAALEILAKDTRFDAVLCDLMMPNVDGPALYEHIASTTPHLVERVLFCSGGAFTPRVRTFLETISSTILDKPVSTTHLRESIEAIAKRTKNAK